MKVLFVCSGNGQLNPFIKEQEKSLQKIRVNIDYFRINGKGVVGYLKNYGALKRKIQRGGYDLVHAHYGLSGLLATIQRKVPVVVTYHGSDVNRKSNRIFSIAASRLAKYNILVNKTMIRQLHLKKGYNVIPCGIDFSLFFPMDKQKARKQLGMDPRKNYLLFSSAFDIQVKNYPLAKAAVKKMKRPAELVELKNKTRKEVNLLFNACDLLLMTSFTEGSPQVVKEALACNTPVVSTDVGDVRDLLSGIENCYIAAGRPGELANKIDLVLKSNRKCNGRAAMERYELQTIAEVVRKVYNEVSQS